MAVVLFHAHPDDEAIFTGGTIARLHAAGHRVVAVFGTHDVLHGRASETQAAADVLGIDRVEFLGYEDSGMAGDPRNLQPGTFSGADVRSVAEQLAALLVEEQADALTTYDARGIYGHPDHVQVHRAGALAAELAVTPTVYEATVDREYLHFVETHLVVSARSLPRDLGLAGTDLGSATIEIDLTLDVHDVLEVKRRAMAAHASQIPEAAFPEGDFGAVYGFEWFLRRGAAGPLDTV